MKSMTIKKGKAKTWILIVCFASLLVMGDIYILRNRYINANANIPVSSTVYDREKITKYDGSDPNLPVLLAMDGLVYDVSAGREDFYNPGQPYHFLAGRDSSYELHIAGGKIIKEKYPVVGVYK